MYIIMLVFKVRPEAELQISECPSQFAECGTREPGDKQARQQHLNIILGQLTSRTSHLACAKWPTDKKLVPELSFPSPGRSPAAPPWLTGSDEPQTPADGGSCLSAG